MKYIFQIALFVLPLGLLAQYGHVDHWETAIHASEEWEYFVGTSAPPSDWNEENFNASSWSKGKGGLGFGYTNLRTTVPKGTSLYLRKVFTIKDTSKIQAAVLSADWDDAFVAYFNGYEVAREGIGTPWVEPAYNEFADYERKAQLVNGGKYSDFLVRKNQLRYASKNGDNVLAIQIHNVSNISPDLAAFFNLHYGMRDTGRQFDFVPGWFETPPVFADSSTLPIVKLTSPRPNDSVKIDGSMEIIWHGRGKKNSFYEEGEHYNGPIQIKYRGNSTLQFPKKSFTIETVDSSGVVNDVPLVGMPADNDWVLYAPYIDKSLLRNYVSYSLAHRMQEYAPKTQLVEVMHNGYYIGVFVLTEKIKRGRNRVNIEKLDYVDTNQRTITGGYMLKSDWGNDTNYNAFNIKHDKYYPGFESNTFQYYRPKPDSLHSKQKEYIKDFVQKFENALLSDTFDAKHGYKQYFNINSMADYMLMREISKEVDGYRYSVYFYKNHEKDDNRLHMSPVWDFNLGYGNVDFSTNGAELPRGWLWDIRRGRIFWFLRMLDDPAFADRIHCRWQHFRAHLATNDMIEKIIDDAIIEMGQAEYRNHYTWKTIGRYIWPNYFVGDTYEEEIDYLKDWIFERVAWMDDNMPGNACLVSEVPEIESTQNTVTIYPNPARDYVVVLGDKLSRVEVLNVNGQLIKEFSEKGAREITFSISGLTPGLYFVRATTTSGQVVNNKLVVN